MVGGMLASIFKDFFTIELSPKLEFIYSDLAGNKWDIEHFDIYTELVFGGNNRHIIETLSRRQFAYIFDNIDNYLAKYRVCLTNNLSEWEIVGEGKKLSYDAFNRQFIDNFLFIDDILLEENTLNYFIDKWFIDNRVANSNKLLARGIWAPPKFNKII